MITMICRYALQPGITREQAVVMLEQGIPYYQNRTGLIRKYNCIDLDRNEGLGIYLWTDRALAEAYFAEVRTVIRDQVGAEPEATYLDTPLVVDNVTGEGQVAV